MIPINYDLKKKIKHVITFFQKDIWKEPESPFKRFLYKWLRITISSTQGFMQNKGFDKASTLTFYTLLSIVPLLAIGFGIAQEFGLAEQFTDQIKSNFQSQPQVAEKLIQFSHSTLKTTKGGIIASFGIVILFWTVIKTVGNIESFFDEIWQIKTSRTLWQEIKSYTPLILLFPIFLVGSSSSILYASTVAIQTFKGIHLDFLSSFILYMFKFISYLVSWALLSFLYIYLPNTKVSWRVAFLAGIITGVIFFIWQWIYVTFQAHASSYGIIYGSFAAVPLFLIWLNYSWLIIIFGAELSYHIQHK